MKSHEKYFLYPKSLNLNPPNPEKRSPLLQAVCLSTCSLSKESESMLIFRPFDIYLHGGQKGNNKMRGCGLKFQQDELVSDGTDEYSKPKLTGEETGV